MGCLHGGRAASRDPCEQLHLFVIAGQPDLIGDAKLRTLDDSSLKLLERVGFAFEAMVRLPGNDEEVKLFARVA